MCLDCYKQCYLLLAGCTFTISYFYRNSIGPIADVLERELDTNASGVAMLSSFQYASYCLTQMAVGMILEIYSYRAVSLFASISQGITMIIFSFTPNITIGVIIRFLSGFITAFPLVTSIAIVSQLYGNRYVGTFTGIVICSGNASIFSLSYLQAFLYEKYNDWRSIYFYFGIFSIVIFIGFLIITIYEYTHHHEHGVSEKSEIALKQSADYKSLRTTCDSMDTPVSTSMPPTTISDRSFLQFIAFRTHSEDMMIKSRMWQSLKRTLRNKLNYVLGIHMFCVYVIIYAMNGLWVINYLMAKYDYSRESATLISGVFFLAIGVGSVAFGKMSHIYSKRIVLLGICTLIMSIATILFIYFSDNASFELILTLSIINGIGCGGATPIHYLMVREYNCGQQCEDTATGFANFQGSAAGFIAQLLMGWMIDWNWNLRGDTEDPNLRHYSVADYEFAFSLCTAALVIAIAMLFFLRESSAVNLR